VQHLAAACKLASTTTTTTATAEFSFLEVKVEAGSCQSEAKSAWAQSEQQAEMHHFDRIGPEVAEANPEWDGEIMIIMRKNKIISMRRLMALTGETRGGNPKERPASPDCVIDVNGELLFQNIGTEPIEHGNKLTADKREFLIYGNCEFERLYVTRV
jgi:hypothetical protein